MVGMLYKTIGPCSPAENGGIRTMLVLILHHHGWPKLGGKRAQSYGNSIIWVSAKFEAIDAT